MRFSSATDDTVCLSKSLQITCSLSVIICMTRVHKANIYIEVLSIKSFVLLASAAHAVCVPVCAQ